MSVKVYQNVLNFAKTADKFLFLDGAGCSADIPEDFWQSLAQYPENVQSYLACLIARLISLETKHGLRQLEDIYKELSMTGDDTKALKSWLQVQGPWDSNRKHLAVYLQRVIVCTIHHLKTFYGYVYHPCVKFMYSMWNKVRGPEGLYPGDDFEFKVMSDLSYTGSQHSSLGRWFFQIIDDPEELERQIKDLVDQCSQNHRDPTTGVQNLGLLSICNYTAVAESLSYYKLLDILRHDSTMVDVAVSCIMAKLEEATSSVDVEKSEVTILPLLQLFKSIAPMASNMEIARAYQSLIPLYLWPQPFACETRKVLDFLQEENKLKGCTFRKTIAAEQNTTYMKGMTKDQCNYVIVDTSEGVCRATAFLKAFDDVPSRAQSGPVQKLLIMHIFRTVGEWEEKRLRELNQCLKNCGNFDYYYREAQAVLEAANAKNEDNEALDQFVKDGLETLYALIKKESASLEEGNPGLGGLDGKSPSPDRSRGELCQSAYPSPPLTVLSQNSSVPDGMKDMLRNCIQTSGKKASKLQRKNNTVNPKSVMRRKKVNRHSTPTPEKVETSSISDHSEVGAENGWEEMGKNSRLSPSSVSPPLQILDIDTSSDQPLSPTHQSTVSSSSSLEFQIVFDEDNPPSAVQSRTASLTRPTSGGSRTQSPMYSPTHSMRSHEGPVTSSPIRTRRKTGTRPKDGASVKKSSLKSAYISVMNEDILREVKVVVVGNDKTLGRMSHAYAELRQDEPALFTNLQVCFYYIPLSVTTFVSSAEDRSALKKKDNMPEFLSEASQNSILGEDVWLACYLSQFDSWYERNVLLAVHKALRIIPAWDEASHPLTPAQTSPIMPTFSISQKVPPSPAQILHQIVSNYCRNADSVARLRIYKAVLSVKGEKNPITMTKYFLQRLDIQKLSKKNKGPSKCFEANINVFELSLDDSHIPSQMINIKDLWSLRSSSIPRPEDDCLASPESESLELNILRGNKASVAEQLNFHVYKFSFEVKEKPFSVMLDSDFDRIVENVLRVEVSLARTPQLPNSPSGPTNASNCPHSEGNRDIHFPLMTFWPLDLSSN